MYTMLWQEKGADRWDRFESEEEVKTKLREIENHPDSYALGDVWIFSPKADEFACTGEDFLEEEEDYPIIITDEQAMEIAQTAYDLRGYGIPFSTGYYMIFEDKNNQVNIDINKERDTTNREYFAVYVSFGDDESEYRYTDCIDVQKLRDLILEIAHDCATSAED